jgi:hypothetical protein
MVMAEEWNELLAEETEFFGEDLLKCHFIHHKSHFIWRCVVSLGH